MTSHPALSKCCGSEAIIAQEWVLVWEQFAGANNQDIHAGMVGVNGNVTAADFTIDASPQSETRPAVSSKTDFVAGSDRWMVVYQYRHSAGAYYCFEAGYKREGRHDDFITITNAQCAHGCS